LNGANTRIAVVFNRSLTKVNDSNPANTGTRAVLYQSATGNTGTWQTTTPVCGSYDFTEWTGWPLPAAEPFCMQFGQELASYSTIFSNNLAWAWHDTRSSADGKGVVILGSTRVPGPAYNGSNTNWLTPIQPGIPWYHNGLGCPNGLGNAWGDYEGMTVDPATGIFYAGWGDSRGGSSGTTQVYSAHFTAP
jgi:hypothetical protein